MGTNKTTESWRERSWAVLRFAGARFRFGIVFLVVALLVGKWDVIANHADAWLHPAKTSDGPAGGSEIEFYCPMDGATSDHSGNCPSCGMPLVKRLKRHSAVLPVDSIQRVQISPRRLALANIGTSTVAARELKREIQAVGLIDYDESRITDIAALIAGQVIDLQVTQTGQTVARDQVLYTLASERSQQPAAPVAVTSPVAGTIIRKDLHRGSYVKIGDVPLTVADLSRVVLKLRIDERDGPLVHAGQEVTVQADASPALAIRGTIRSLGCQLDPKTRTVEARVELPNETGQLKPGTFVSARIVSPITAQTLGGTQSTGVQQPDAAKRYAAALAPYLKAHDLLVDGKTQGVQQLLTQSDSLLAAVGPNDPGPTRGATANASATSDDLPSLRHAFGQLSATMIAAGKTIGLPADAPTARIFSCPMGKPDWIQLAGPTANPHGMPSCGFASGELPRMTDESALVLAVPRAAVVDTGQGSIAFLRSAPGQFDMRKVTVGPPAGDYFPVLDGLKEGDQVVSSGAFLVDAETRLNPAR